MCFVDFVRHEEIVEVTQAHVLYLIRVHEILGQRLEHQPPKENESRWRIVTVGLDQIGSIPRQLNFDCLLCFIAQNVEFYIVAFELSFDDFGHLDAFTVELDKSVTGDGEIVDGEQYVTLRAKSRSWNPRRRRSSPGRPAHCRVDQEHAARQG